MIFYLFFPGQLDSLYKKHYLLILPIYCAPLIAYIGLGFYSRFYADDYCSAAKAKSLGVIKAAQYWYVNWSGRFSANLYDAIMGKLGPDASPFSSLFIILIWLAVLIGALIYLMQREQQSATNKLVSVFLALLVVFSTLEVTPTVNQSLYWGQGMRSVIPPLILGTALVGFFRSLIKDHVQGHGRKLARTIGVALLIIIAGGFSESYAALQVVVFSMALVYSLVFPVDNKKQAILYISLGLIAALLSMFIVILAPGNKFRQASFPPPPDLLNLLEISYTSMQKYLDGLFGSQLKVLNLIGVFLSSAAVGTGLFFTISEDQTDLHDHARLKKFVIPSLLILPILYVCFVPAAYGMSREPPSRNEIIPTYFFICSLVFTGFQIGQIIRDYYQRHFKNATLSMIGSLIPSLVVFAFCINAIHSAVSHFQMLSEYKASAEQWDIVETMILDQKDSGAKAIIVPITANPLGIGGIGSVDWVNECASDYYGVEKIIGQDFLP